MKTLTQTLCAAVALCAALVSTSANAATPPRPPADCGLDADHDGWCVKDPNRNNMLVGTVDCNDADDKVNPGATEIPGDTIDQDCSGADTTVPAYAKNFGCSATSAACLKRLDAEIMVCQANAAGCAVNFSSGKFVTSFGHYFVDTDCNGVREVLDQAGKDAYDAKVRQGHRCVSAPRPACTNCPKATGAKPTPKLDPKTGERLSAVEKVTTDLSADVTALAGRTDNVETVLADTGTRLDGLDVLVADHGTRLDGLDKRVTDHDSELQAARQQIAGVDETAGKALTASSNASADADTALHSGVSAGLSVGPFVKASQGVVLVGQTLRGSTLAGLLLTGHVGGEFPSVLVRGTASVGIGGEEGTKGIQQSFLFEGGGEVLWKLDNPANAFGLGIGFLTHLSGDKVSGRQAESMGVRFGPIYELSPGGKEGYFRLPIRIAPSLIYEAIGTNGSNAGGKFRADGSSLAGMVTLTIGAGTGSFLR